MEMDNLQTMSTDEQRIQRILEAFLLSRRSLRSSAAETSFHMDEDYLTAFAEGNLSERESTPLVNHLVDCGFCRNKTAELVRFDLAFAGADTHDRIAPANEPHKLSEVISGILTKIFGTAEGAVFAHNEKETEEKTPQDDDTRKEKE